MLCPVRATDPPYSSTLEIAAIPKGEAQPALTSHFGFFMKRMTSAARTKLFYGEFLGLALFIFARSIVTPLTTITLKPN
jgi:hypothetical protein